METSPQEDVTIYGFGFKFVPACAKSMIMCILENQYKNLIGVREVNSHGYIIKHESLHI